MTRNHKVTPVVLAEVPEDGGRWAIYCEHFDDNGEVIEVSILQDSNKRRLASWRAHSLDWCAVCQELHDYGTLDYYNDPYNPERVAVAQ